MKRPLVATLFLASLLTTASLSAQTLSWTKRDAKVHPDLTMNAATFGAGKYAVVGYRGTFVNNVNGIENQVSTSTDGATWTTATVVPTTGSIRDLKYGGGLFVAPVEDDNKTSLILTSPDAGTWTARATGVGNLTSVAYGSGFVGTAATNLWIGVGSANGGNNVVRSTDGITWTRVSTGSAVDLFQVTYGRNVFLAISRSGTLLYSSNGTTWTKVTVPGLPSGATFLGLTWDGSEFLLLVNDAARNPQIYVSGDGAAWAASGPKLTAATIFDATIAGNGSLAAIAGATLAGGNTVFTAPVTAGFFATVGAWSTAQVVDAEGFGFVFITYTNGLWIAGGYSTDLYTAAGTGGGSGGGGGATAPAITTHPSAQAASVGGSVTFTATVSGTGLAYQWLFNNTVIGGATGATYTIPSVAPTNAGSYSVRATNSGGTVTSNGAVLTVNSAGAGIAFLSNLSVRARAGSGDQTLIVGVTAGGGTAATAKTILIRGVGPTLTAFGVEGALADPVLTVLSGTTTVATNDDWVADANLAAASAAAGAFALTPGSRDAVIFGSGIGAGSYTVQLTGKAGATGNALVELYDTAAAASVTAASTRFTNLSARTFGGTGSETLIVGFNVAGTGSKRLVIRAVGPGLAAFGVAGTMPDPKIELYQGQTKVGENDNWDGATLAAQQAVGAFGLPANSKDAVLVSTLQPGSYTVQVTGGTTGVAIVEVYEAP